MTDPTFTTLVCVIIAFAAGLVIGRLYNVVKADDDAMLLTELEHLTLTSAEVIIGLRADNARLQAELAERERQIEALGKARLSGLASGNEADTDYGVRLAGEIDGEVGE